MFEVKHRVVFFHGYGSDCETNKFTHITHPFKTCRTVDYTQMPYQDVYDLYSEIVSDCDKDDFWPILVGHSLGGYWAHRLGFDLGVPAIMLNPQLFPTKSDIRDLDRYEPPGHPRAPSYFYIETGDDVIDVKRTIAYAEPLGKLYVHEGGHHKIENLDRINQLIEEVDNSAYYLVTDPCDD